MHRRYARNLYIGVALVRGPCYAVSVGLSESRRFVDPTEKDERMCDCLITAAAYKHESTLVPLYYSITGGIPRLQLEEELGMALKHSETLSQRLVARLTI